MTDRPDTFGPLSNENLKRAIAFSFIFLGIVFGYFLGWKLLSEGRNGGWIGICFGIYFFSTLFWMFRSMKMLYIAVAIPFIIIVGFYLLYLR